MQASSVSRLVVGGALIALAVSPSCRKESPKSVTIRTPVTSNKQSIPGDGLVDVKTVIPDVHLDIRYATTNNFTKTAVYEEPRCVLRYSVLQALSRAADELREGGYSLWIWDCYRPFSIQEKLWAVVPDAKYVAKPVRDGKQLVEGSKHNRGAAIDLTLARDGVPIAMPTEYDDFSKKAHRDYDGATPEQIAHRSLLEDAFVRQGFEPMSTEWWHFDGPGWASFPLEDVSLRSIPKITSLD